MFAPGGFYFTNLQFDACVRKRGFIRIVGDEDNGFARKTRKQICDDLRLGRRIQRGKRLVKQQNIAAEGKQAREGDPLALTARHLVRALVGKRRRAADDSGYPAGAFPIGLNYNRHALRGVLFCGVGKGFLAAGVAVREDS